MMLCIVFAFIFPSLLCYFVTTIAYLLNSFAHFLVFFFFVNLCFLFSFLQYIVVFVCDVNVMHILLIY